MSTKNIMFITLLFTFLSCRSGLERKYKFDRIERDLKEVSAQVTPEEYEMITAYIARARNMDVFITEYKDTYQDILNDAKSEVLENEQKIEEDKQRAIALEKKEKRLQERIAMLCGKKWGIKLYAFEVEVSDHSEETKEHIKKLLSMTLSPDNYTFSFVKKGYKDYARAVLVPETLKLFNSNGRRKKEYFSDGTFNVTYADVVHTGYWDFNEYDEIYETRPYDDDNDDLTNKVTYIINIERLTEKAFMFTEKRTTFHNKNNVMNRLIVMESE